MLFIGKRPPEEVMEINTYALYQWVLFRYIPRHPKQHEKSYIPGGKKNGGRSFIFRVLLNDLFEIVHSEPILPAKPSELFVHRQPGRKAQFP